jgi:exodeoxyribonuclease VII large subunit
MPELVADKTVFSLLEVMKSIQNMVATHYSNAYWIKAEMNKLNFYSHSGHCYPELVEKENGKIIAQIRATLWKDDYFRINTLFLNTVKEPLKDGIKILFCARIGFDPVYGLTLRIIDIDSSYSLGDLEKEKAETIAQLRKEQLFNANKLVPMARVPQRIAIISVETSKGYSDFMNILDHNPWNYKFFTMLFPALLQGEKAVDAIVNQLANILQVASHFDVVAIVRGGGGDVGLSCYNNLQLAKAIATFPLPIITGIGHSTNETVAELISYKNAITPTELADFLLQQFHNFSVPVANAQQSIIRFSKSILDYQNMRFEKTIVQFKSDSRKFISENKHLLSNRIHAIEQQTSFMLQRQRELQIQTKLALSKASISTLENRRQNISLQTEQLSRQSALQLNNASSRLQNLTQLVRIMDPKNILKRGFSITLHQGKAIKSTENITPGTPLTTILANGTIISNTISTTKTEEDER